jgi:peptidyl-prolyl cis-trans isomerase SurA
MSSQVLYRTPTRTISIGQFTDSLRMRVDMRGYTLNRAGLERAMNKLMDPQALTMATADLEQRYPEFASLMQEFNDGILLFKVEEKEVWSKLRFDTTDARAFYDTTRSRWMTDRAYAITEVYTLSDSLAKDVAARARAGENLSDLASRHTMREGGRDKKGASTGLVAKTSKLAQRITPTTKVGDIIGPFAIDAGWSVIRLDGITEPRQKSFDDALSELAPAYQDALQKRLTETWLSGVRTKHPVTFDAAAIDRIWGKAR